MAEAQFFLQRVLLAADGGLGQIESRRRVGKTHSLAHGQKARDLL